MARKTRCVLGIIFGILLGLSYGAVSQWINRIFLPGIPLFEPAPGIFLTVIIDMVVGGVLGFLVAWPEEFLLGVLISSITGIIFFSLLALQSVLGTPDNIFGATVVLFISFLPRVVIFLPVTILVRWVVGIWEKETLYSPYSLKGRLRSVLLLVIVGLVAGIFSLYSGEARRSLSDLNQLILVGRQASSSSSLPQPLQRVNNFLNYSTFPYTLQILTDPETIPVPQSASGFDRNITAIEVLFSNGFRFGCIYSSSYAQPNCSDY